MSGSLPEAGSPERIAWATQVHCNGAVGPHNSSCVEVSSMIAELVIYMNKAKVYHGDFKVSNTPACIQHCDMCCGRRIT